MTQQHSTAQQVWEWEYRDCTRSAQYKEGALRGLRRALGEVPAVAGAPYAAGTAEQDAWRAGFEAGYEEGKLRRAAAQRWECVA